MEALIETLLDTEWGAIIIGTLILIAVIVTFIKENPKI